MTLPRDRVCSRGPQNQGYRVSFVTKIEGGDGDARYPVQETLSTYEQLVERTCAWCGEPVAYGGRGRPPRYCSAVHRRRAWEVRTAEGRAARPVGEGGQSREPVREVVQRTVRTVVLQESDQVRPAPQPAQRLSGQPYTLPEDAVEWIEALAVLRREALTNPRIHPFREHVARACERTAEALRTDPSTPADPPDPK